jgi:hypothetical protein
VIEILKAADAVTFERIQFVCKALKKNTGHPFTTVVHVEHTRSGTRFVAADGKRLHVAEIRGRIPKGDYKPKVKRDIITLELVDDINYPNWKNIVPETALNKGTLKLDHAGIGKDMEMAADMSLAFNDFVQKTGTIVNLKYLDDLPKREWRLSVHRDRKTVVMMEQKDAPNNAFAVFAPLASSVPKLAKVA